MSDEDVGSDVLSDDDDIYDVPSRPPNKPLSLLNYYIESNRDRIIEENNLNVSQANSRLRQMFKEELGTLEKQKWKREHKKLLKKFNKLLSLYKQANPDFNSDAYYDNKSKSNKSPNKRKRNNNNNKSSVGGFGHQKVFMLQEFDSDNDNNMDSKTGRKRKKRGSNINSKQKKRKDNNNNDGTEMIETLIDDISKPIKSKRRKKGEGLDINKDELDKMRGFVDKMRVAARNDWTSNLQKQPTLNMYKMLDTVVNELSKKLLHNTFLDECKILDAIRDWVHPLPDGSLPPVKIRDEMYRILMNMELHKMDDCVNYLEASEERSNDPSHCQINDINDKFNIKFKLKGLCKTLMLLWCHKDETNENKQLLRKVIDKLIRKITHSNISYQEMREENVEMNKEAMNNIIQRNKYDKKRRQLLKQRNMGMSSKKRASIPQKPSFDFVFNPQSNVDTSDKMDNKMRKSGKYSGLELGFKRIKNTKSRNQAYKPSITGRRV